MSLKKIKEISMINNRVLMIGLNLVSLVLFFASLTVFTKLATWIAPVQSYAASGEMSFRINLLDC